MASAQPASSLPNRPTYITHEDQRFLIMDAPTNENLQSYIDECKKHNVLTIVRACEPSYSTVALNKAGIQVVEMPFTDGDPPPMSVITSWLDLCDKEFAQPDKRTLAVHCVAGLGRAPVLVAISLVELGMEPLDAISFVRKKRRGAINARQLKFLENYKPQRRRTGCCIIS